ncbi:hypothetical protein BJF78_30145 [Pseudonocardia sp. CNS-139]|nr:hypothetical protein BJF78_30145 [Pseudonocardia sp. CNS-139]
MIYQHRDGRAFTLVEALRAVYGVGDASIIREDGTPVVLRAGNASAITYGPTGRTIRRRTVQRGTVLRRTVSDRTSSAAPTSAERCGVPLSGPSRSSL